MSMATAATPSRDIVIGSPDDPRTAMLTTQLKMVKYRPDALIDVLHAAQDIYGSLSKELLAYVATALQLPPSRVLGVATFYHLFRFDPPGDHTCTICTGTACFVKGADALMAGVSEVYGVAQGGTRPDGALSLLEARCLGSCGLAPIAIVDGTIVAKTTPDALVAAVREAGVRTAAEDAVAGLAVHGSNGSRATEGGAL
jgi:bidirectional [NiFe] hydrogenase diaphorase subunit